jgi:hypothetical protein
MSDILDLAWRANAACVGEPTAMFFHDSLSLRTGNTFSRERALQHQPVRDALNMCALCQVKTECLDTAMTVEHGNAAAGRHGIWGGLLPHERAELARPSKKRYRVKPIPHGTNAGYEAHRRREETPCAECRAAHSRSNAADQKRHREKVTAR